MASLCVILTVRLVSPTPKNITDGEEGTVEHNTAQMVHIACTDRLEIRKEEALDNAEL